VVATVGQAGAAGRARALRRVRLHADRGVDANNVTTSWESGPSVSQLLCEQVVGAGCGAWTMCPTRKLDCSPRSTWTSTASRSRDPVQGATGEGARADDRPKNHVRALPERRLWRCGFRWWRLRLRAAEEPDSLRRRWDASAGHRAKPGADGHVCPADGWVPGRAARRRTVARSSSSSRTASSTTMKRTCKRSSSRSRGSSSTS